MNKNLKWVLIGVAAVGIIVGGVYYQQPKVNDELSDSQVVKAPKKQILNVNGLQVKPKTLIDEYRTVGVLMPDEEVNLSFETSGKVIEINFEEGTHVKKGDLLAKVNDDNCDNIFLYPQSRFIPVEEDEAMIHPLVNEYDKI